jgi:hypothetical protein
MQRNNLGILPDALAGTNPVYMAPFGGVSETPEGAGTPPTREVTLCATERHFFCPRFSPKGPLHPTDKDW